MLQPTGFQEMPVRHDAFDAGKSASSGVGEPTGTVPTPKPSRVRSRAEVSSDGTGRTGWMRSTGWPDIAAHLLHALRSGLVDDRRYEAGLQVSAVARPSRTPLGHSSTST